MPSIRIQDPFGYHFQLDSSDPAIVGAWLAERVADAVSANASLQPVMRITIFPLMENDWPAPSGEDLWFNAEQMQKLYDLLHGAKSPWKSEQFQKEKA
jgi:hypothetical protein